jgi:hypothetical protein
VDTKSYNSTALADQSFCAKKLDWDDPVTEVLTLASERLADAQNTIEKLDGLMREFEELQKNGA